jgi:excisionase family DNA binding protein
MEGGDFKMITIKDVMSTYKVSRPTVQGWMKKGLPFYKIERSVRFDPSEVDAWIRGDRK